VCGYRKASEQGYLNNRGTWQCADHGVPPVVVCTENLDPDVVVMKSAKDGQRFDASSPLNRAEDRRILVKGSMRSDGVVIVRIGSQDPAQMRLA
jgi:hypothetical protein